MEKKIKKNILKGFLITISMIVVTVVGLGFAFPGLIWTRSLGVTYTQTDYNYKLGIWRLDDVTPFKSEKDMGVLIMATSPSVTNEGLKVFPVSLANAISKMRINGTHLIDLTVKTPVENRLLIEAVILETTTNMITKMELLSTDNKVLVSSPAIVLPVVDKVTFKSTITAKEGV